MGQATHVGPISLPSREPLEDGDDDEDTWVEVRTPRNPPRENTHRPTDQRHSREEPRPNRQDNARPMRTPRNEREYVTTYNSYSPLEDYQL